MKATTFMYYLVYFLLLIITYLIVYKGPLTNIYKEDNIDFVESYKNVKDLEDPIKWPTLAVCKSPIYKDLESYHIFVGKGRDGFNGGFKDETEFNKLKSDAFFTDPNETIFALTIGDDFDNAMRNYGKIPVELPFVDTTFEDLDYIGACGVIHLETLKNFMKENGQFCEDEIDGHWSKQKTEKF